MERKIIHVDMDAFYAAVEQRDHPELRGKPVVIGGKTQFRGVVSTASYEARKFGIHSAMPLTEAYRRCPQAVFLPPDLAKYREASQKIMQIFHFYTPLVEALSLDEAFLDVTGSQRLFGNSELIGQKIKKRIKEELDLTASIGIAPNKFLAKLASDLDKPDGLVVIKLDEIKTKLWPLSVKKLWGIGGKSAQRLKELNIKTIGQLAQTDVNLLVNLLGSWGVEVHQLANGVDHRPVVPEREAHSIGHETTFSEDIGNRELLQNVLLDLAQDVGWRLRRANLKSRTIVLKMRLQDFQTITRNHTLCEETNRDDIIYQEAVKLFNKNFSGEQSLRLIGVTAAGLVDANQARRQVSLFSEEKDKSQELYQALDKINNKYGKKTITRARLIKTKEFE